MFSELPKLFDRNFAVAYFLPAAIFLAGSDYLLGAFGLLQQSTVKALTANNSWLGATAVVALTWLLALFLVGANRALVRLKEGYGLLDADWNPFKRLETKRFDRLEAELERLKQLREAAREGGGSAPPEIEAELIRKGYLRAIRFPDRKGFLLPTAFGNTLRAFEVYSRSMYGAEATELWSRLLAVTPKEYRELVDYAKAQVDFWVNLWALFLALIVEYLGLSILQRRAPAVWLLLVAIVAVPFASYWSRKLAEQWGKMVKACFDVFLPELRKKLEFPTPESRESERQQWQRFSQAALFHLPGRLPERTSSAEGPPKDAVGTLPARGRGLLRSFLSLIAAVLTDLLGLKGKPPRDQEGGR